MMQAFFINSPMNSQTRETEIPVPKEDEILLKVMASGVCGTDVHIYKGEYFGGYPRIP
jgi:threonine dehydrogenase-like Zn-dependent dehydrogenase